jgi:hypothetical protein
MEVIGSLMLLALCGAGIYGLLSEVKHMKACVAKEHAQQAMYEELLNILKKESEE